VGAWSSRKDRRLNYREKFSVDGGNQIWRNYYECEEEEFQTPQTAKHDRQQVALYKVNQVQCGLSY